MATAIIAIGQEFAGTAFNLLECGTIGQVGCVKESDTAIHKSAEFAMRQNWYGAKTSQISKAQALNNHAGIWQQANQQWTQKQRNCCGPAQDGFCGDLFSQHTGIPADDETATYLCGQTYSMQELYNGITARLNALPDPVMQSVVSGIAAAVGSAGVSGGSSMPKGALIVGGAVAGLVLLRLLL